MVKIQNLDGNPLLTLWDSALGLISLNPDQRDQAIEQLSQVDGYQDSALMAYILITRLAEPELEIRFHLVQLLGSLLDFESAGMCFSDRVLGFVHHELSQLTRFQIEKILEVSSRYLAADWAVKNIFKLCSYAGNILSGIVNDRKQPVQIRQQAINYCGELGFLDSKTALENLVRRVEKARNSFQSTRSRSDEDQLYIFAQAAVAKLEL
jgi:hypothetical protein